tara:strand:- start:659 stop:1363 length:705 start_codon:yes stop_codon:yes gene_type:complete
MSEEIEEIEEETVEDAPAVEESSIEEAPEPVEEAPAPAPGLDTQAIQNALVEAMKGAGESFRSQQPQSPDPAHPWDDTSQYWLLSPDASDEERAQAMHDRITDYVKHMINDAISPVRNNVDQAMGGLYHLNQISAMRPEVKEHYTEAVELLNQGQVNDLSTALELVRFRKGGQETGLASSPATSPRAPFKPVPPRTATAPAAKGGSTPVKRQRGIPDVYSIFDRGVKSGKIKLS